MDAKRKKTIIIGAAIAGGGILLVLYLRAQAGASSASGAGGVPVYGGLGPNFSSGSSSFTGSPIAQQANGGDPGVTIVPRPGSNPPPRLDGGGIPGPNPKPIVKPPVNTGIDGVVTAIQKWQIKNKTIIPIGPKPEEGTKPTQDPTAQPIIIKRIGPITPINPSGAIGGNAPAGASLYGNQVRGSGMPEPTSPDFRA